MTGAPYLDQEELDVAALSRNVLILEKGGQWPPPTSRQKRARYGAPVMGCKDKGKVTPRLNKRRATLTDSCGLFEGVTQLQDAPVIVMTADDLNADGEAGC
jgi:hypothetical protein